MGFSEWKRGACQLGSCHGLELGPFFSRLELFMLVLEDVYKFLRTYSRCCEKIPESRQAGYVKSIERKSRGLCKEFSWARRNRPT